VGEKEREEKKRGKASKTHVGGVFDAAEGVLYYTLELSL
jgi:hypothetical protein